MSITILGTSDPTLEEFAQRLAVYDSEHPNANIELYRHSPYSVRIRIMDDGFRNKTKSMRHQEVWPILFELSEDTLSELSYLILVTPEERATVSSSREFDHPIPAAV